MKKIIFSLTVDWEGEHFHNLSDLLKLRKQIGNHIPITHFICPAYFSKSIKNARQKIQKAIFDNDEIALHIHCFESLIKQSNVEFRTKPDFYNKHSKFMKKFFSLLPKKLQAQNTGRGVPLSAYTYEEIVKIIETSKTIMLDNFDIKQIDSFRAGGWLASDNVLLALENNNFKYDSSATPPEVLSQNYCNNNDGNFKDDYDDSYEGFTEMIIKMWGHQIQTEYYVSNSLTQKYCNDSYITPLTQPYCLNNLIEMPNNVSMSDFASVEKTMLPVLKKAIESIKNNEEKDFFYNVGFHQEGDIFYKVPIVKLFQYISKKNMKNIEFKTVKNAGEIFRPVQSKSPIGQTIVNP